LGDYSTQPQRSQIAQKILFAEGMIESRFWKVIGEPRGDYSRLRDKAPRKHDLPGGGVGKRNLKETFLSKAKGACAQRTVVGSAELGKVCRG